MDLISFYKLACENFISFSGSGLFVILTAVIITVLAILEKNEKVKTVLVTYPIYCLILFAFPLWSLYTAKEDDGEILYRILWLIPFSGIVCFGLVKLIFSFEGKKRACLFVASAVLIMLCGSFVYSNPLYVKAENKYHVPDTVVKICDEIIVPGREIRAAFPIEFITYVRQYTPLVFLPYGRDSLLGGFFDSTDLFEEMQKSTADAKVLATELRKLNTPYLIINENVSFEGNLSQYGFVYVTTIDGYDIYLDNNAYIGIDDINYR